MIPTLTRMFGRLTLLLLALMLLGVVAYALAANITIPATRAGKVSSFITANDLKPSSCNGVAVSIVTSVGTTGADLLLGNASNGNLNGLDGDDCIVGGMGDDTINGGDGYDVCNGGLGANVFSACEVCTGNGSGTCPP